MLTYPEIPWRDADPSKVTDQQIDTWRAGLLELCAAYSRVTEGVLQCLKKHKRVAYWPAETAEARFDEFLSRVRAARERASNEEKRLSQVRQREAKVLRAGLWLRERGKVPVLDYDQERAVEFADDLAFREELARRLAEGGPHKFYGHSCDDECSGWDGESAHCACGSRRVAWVASDFHSFEKPSVYAEAY